MKVFIRLAVLALVVFGLFWSNPGEEQFETYIRNRVEKRLVEDAGDSRLGRLLTGMGASVAGSIAAGVSERKNYGVMSIYKVDVGADGSADERWTFVGIGGRFIEVETPDRDR